MPSIPSVYVARVGIFCLTLAIYLFTLGTQFYSSDGQVMYETGRALALDHRLDIPPSDLPQVIEGQEGKFYSKYDPGLALLSVPFIRYADHIAETHQANRYAVAAFAVLWISALAMALNVTLLFIIAQRLYDMPTALSIALIAAFATILMPYARLYFSEAVLAFCLTGAVWAILTVNDAPFFKGSLAGLFMAFGILTRASLMIYLPALTFLLFQMAPLNRRKWTIGILWGWAMLAILGLLWHNWFRFGSILATGYQEERFMGEAWQGAWGMLFSPGKSIFLYAPPLMMSVRLWFPFRWHYSALAVTLILLTITALGFYGAWWAWHGGWVWGARFLVPLVGLWCLPLGMIPRSLGWLGMLGLLITLGLGVQIIGTFTDVTPHYATVFDDADPDSPEKYRIIHYELAESPVVAGFGRAWDGKLEPSGILHLRDTGLPDHWTTHLPLGVGLMGLFGLVLIVSQFINKKEYNGSSTGKSS